MSAGWRPAEEPGLPRVFTGGWVGYCGYETVRYGYLGGMRTLAAIPTLHTLKSNSTRVRWCASTYAKNTLVCHIRQTGICMLTLTFCCGIPWAHEQRWARVGAT